MPLNTHSVARCERGETWGRPAPREDNIPVHSGLSTSLCWLNKSDRQRATRKQGPHQQWPRPASARRVGGKLTNALLQVAEHVVGLRFDCLGKGSVDTLGLGVELSLAGLNLCGIHLCYLFFRLVAMPCGRGRPAALHAGQTVEIPTVQRLRVVWPCVAGCRDTVSGSRWTKMPHLKRPVVSRQAARIAGWADLISGRPKSVRWPIARR